MNIYEKHTPKELISGNSYVGRGIIAGKTPNARYAAFAYFIMGRSENSRNRVFKKEKSGDITIYPFDYNKVEDPSLIIYSPVRRYKNSIIVTNGDQTDTIYKFLSEGKSFEDALRTRAFEPDRPNFTPRISCVIDLEGGDFSYKMSILKSGDELGSVCNRYTYSYSPINGLGHFLHTYICDGDPIPTFCGEPERVKMNDDIDSFANEIWEHLDKDNKISLYVRYIDLESGEISDRLFNKNA